MQVSQRPVTLLFIPESTDPKDVRVYAWLSIFVFACFVRDLPVRGVGSRGLAYLPDTPVSVDPLPPAELSGFEIELNQGALARIVRVFDWNRIDREFGGNIRAWDLIPTDAVLDYLGDDPSRFDTLPTALQEQLTAGLGPIRADISIAAPNPHESLSHPAHL